MAVIPLAVDQPIWDRFVSVAPLVVIGSRHTDGTFDLAPTHMATPLGWQNYSGFVCSPQHATYQNVQREPQFTASFPRSTQVATSSLAASPRCEDGARPLLALLATRPATAVAGVVVQDCALALECALHSITDGFGANSLIALCRGSAVGSVSVSEGVLAVSGDPDPGRDPDRPCRICP